MDPNDHHASNTTQSLRGEVIITPTQHAQQLLAMDQDEGFAHSSWGVEAEVGNWTEDVDEDAMAPNGSEVSGNANGEAGAASTPLEPHLKGMTTGYKQMYSGKEDKRGRFIWQTEIPKDLGKPAEGAESEKWAIIVRRIRVYNDPKKVLSLHSIVVQSPFVKEILEKVLDGYPGVTAALKRLEFSGRFEPLVHRWPALRDAITDLEKQRVEGDATAEKRLQHAKLLDDLLVEEFSEIQESMADMRKNGVITFQHLWIIFHPNSLIFARHEGQDRALRLQTSQYGVDRNNQPVFWLTCAHMDFDGQRWGTQKLNLSISSFEGTRRVNGLAAFPIELHDRCEEIRTRLIERGAKVEALAGSHFRNYNGVGWRISPHTGGKEKHTVKGRIVIDPFGFNRFQPDYAVYVTPLSSPIIIPPIGGLSHRARRTHGRAAVALADDTIFPSYVDPTYNLDEDVDDGGMPADGFFDEEDKVQRHPALTEDQKLCCTPMVRGYALKEKQWLSFFVNAVSDIPFNERAFSSLNLPKNQKELILGFTSVKQSYRSQFDDVIEGKGKGIIILLSGPPGVGKTLTAESVAEQMKVPLYIMAAGDLGLDPRTVEIKLQDVMSMCSRWGAILLLDEADIFLEERSLHELERNKLVSIFLRVLEYFEGIMFLTTNRVSTFDAAFQSRIHISLEYPALDKKSRKAIWENFLKQHDVAQAILRNKPPAALAGTAKSQPTKKRAADASPATDGLAYTDADKDQEKEDAETEAEDHHKLTLPHQMSEKDINKLADLKLNGRQIKNILKTAQLLSIYKQEPLSYAHVDTVVDTTQHLHKASSASDQARGAVYS